MSKFDIKVEGAEKLIANLKKWQVVKRQAIEDVTKETAIRIESAAKPNCPHEYGRLKASLTHNISGSGRGRASATGGGGPAAQPAEDGVGEPDGPKGLVAVVGTNVPYAHMMEFGSWGDGPKPEGGLSLGRKKDHEPWPMREGGFQFLTRAYIDNKDKYIKRVEDVLKKD